MTTITTTHGTFSGRTVETIVRREYGHRAFVHNGEYIVEPVRGDSALRVLARLRRYEGRCEAAENRAKRDAEYVAYFSTPEGQVLLEELDREWEDEG